MEPRKENEEATFVPWTLREGTVSGAQTESEYSQGEGEYSESPLIVNYDAYRERETFHREMQGTWPAPADDQVDAIRSALDALSGSRTFQTLPSGVSIVPDNRFSTPSSALYGAYNTEHSMSPDSGRSLIPLGRYVFNLMELRPDHAKRCEEDGRLWDLVSAYLDNQFQMWRLGIIADNLEDNGFPSDDIRLVIMRKQPSLWCVSWWPTCLRKDGDK